MFILRKSKNNEFLTKIIYTKNFFRLLTKKRCKKVQKTSKKHQKIIFPGYFQDIKLL